MNQAEKASRTLRIALEEEINDAGGWYAVASALYPEKFNDSPDSAERHLRNSIDIKHNQKFSVYQHQVLKDLAKKNRGRCASIIFDCEKHGYTRPAPITPEQELAEIKQLFLEKQEEFKGLIERMEDLA